MSKAFLDTNILAYAADSATPDKQEIARQLIRRLSEEGALCLSTQVHQEFYVTATRKLGIDPLRAKDILQTLRHMETAVVEPDDVIRAVDGSVAWQLSFWDALILVAARKLNCAVLYTEDLSNGQIFDGVRVVNPFE